MVDIEDIARICHETNKAYCIAIGDDTQVSWDDAPQWQKDSAIQGVTYHLDTIDEGGTPSSAKAHANWLDDKIADGWVHGDVKDEVKKTHPCIVPYNDLPMEQQIKDYLFISIVTTLHGFI